MSNNIKYLIDKLAEEHALSPANYLSVIQDASPEDDLYLAELAVKVRYKIYKNFVYTRGLIEISNICKNNCYYCGIRRDNQN